MARRARFVCNRVADYWTRMPRYSTVVYKTYDFAIALDFNLYGRIVMSIRLLVIRQEHTGPIHPSNF